MRKIIITKSIFVSVIILILCIFVSGFGLFANDQDKIDFSSYFRWSDLNHMENGTAFYTSGDVNYALNHDSEGNLLLPVGDELFYAINGEITASKIKYKNGKAPINATSIFNVDRTNFYPTSQNSEGMFYSEQEDLSSYLRLSNNATDSTKNLNNVTILIEFKDIHLTNPAKAENIFNGDTNSVRDFYSVQSQNLLNIDTFFPLKSNSDYHIYRTTENRSAYNITSENRARAVTEAKLLSSALNSAKPYLESQLVGKDLDTNNDGYVDGVNFVVAGVRSIWNSLLWPHSWDLESIIVSNSLGLNYTLNGLKIGSYGFNLIESIDSGVASHEFAHILGAPDMYHYGDDFQPVGKWDLMESNTTIPQYFTTFVRNKYLNVVNSSQIVTVTENKVVSLKPTSKASSGDVLAYKIPIASTNGKEYFMVEYRRITTAGNYDSTLPGSGLIVYRIREGVSQGNRNAKRQSVTYPDEMYVFRPSISDNETENLSFANLSVDNGNFNSVGKTKKEMPISKYNYDTLYTVDGNNTGIVIETINQTADEAIFKIIIDENDAVPDNYFDDKAEILSAEYVNDANFSGIKAKIRFKEIETRFVQQIKLSLFSDLNAHLISSDIKLNRFITDYIKGVREFEMFFVANTKDDNMLNYLSAHSINFSLSPKIVKLEIIDMDDEESNFEKGIDTKSISWQIILNTKTNYKMSVAANENTSFAVDLSGKVYTTSSDSDIVAKVNALSNITSVSASDTHTLFIDKYLYVYAVGKNSTADYMQVGAHTNIIKAIAVNNATYLLTTTNKIIAVGSKAIKTNGLGQNIQEIANVVDVAASENHAVVITADGKAIGFGNNGAGEINVEQVSGALSVVCGYSFTAVLDKFGNVHVYGNLDGKENVLNWNNVTALSGGELQLMALKNDGTVERVGKNSIYGNFDHTMLYDIEAIACGNVTALGQTHFLAVRIDGKVVYMGTAISPANKDLPNLRYAAEDFIEVTKIIVNISANILYENEVAILTALATPTNANYKRVNYITDKKGIVKIEGNKVTAVAPGKVRIYAYVPGSNASAAYVDVTIEEYIAPTEMFFEEEIYFVKEGEARSGINIKFNPINATLDGNIDLTIQNLDIAKIEIKNNTIYVVGIKKGVTTLTADYSFKGVVLQTVVAIEVVADIEDVTLIAPSKRDYKFGENLDFTNGYFEVNIGGTILKEPITEFNLKLRDDGKKYTELLGAPVNVYFRYAQFDNLYFTINVSNYVEKLEFVESVDPINILYGAPLDLKELKIKRVMANGDENIVTVSSSMITGFDSWILGQQELTIYDSELFLNLNITILDYNKSIDTKNVDVLVYGENPNPITFLSVTTASNAIVQKHLSEFSYSGFNKFLFGKQILNLTLNDDITGIAVKENVAFEIIDTYSSYWIEEHDKLKCEINKSLLLDLTLRFSGGANIPITIDGEFSFYKVENFDNTVGGVKTADISIFVKKLVNGNVVDFMIVPTFTVNVYIVDQVKSIEILSLDIINYNSELVVTLKVVTATGYSEIVSDGFVVKYDKDLLDTWQTLQVTYLGHTANKQIKILNIIVELKTYNKNVEIILGQEFIPPKIYKVMADGQEIEVSKNEYVIISNIDNTKLGIKQTFTIKVQSHSLTINVTVIDFVNNISCQSSEMKVKFGTKLDLSQLLFDLTYESGIKVVKSYAEISANLLFHESIDVKKVGEQKLVLLYDSAKLTQYIEIIVTVNNFFISIEVLPSSKTTYDYKEPLQLQVKSIYADGSESTLNSNEYFTDFDPEKIGEQDVKVTMLKDINIFVIVKIELRDRITSYTVTSKPKVTSFSFGEALDMTGAVVEISYLKQGKVSTKGNDLKPYVFGYNPKMVGKQTLQIKIYDKDIASFDVIVLNRPKILLGVKPGAEFDLKYGLLTLKKPTTIGEILSQVVSSNILYFVCDDSVADDVWANSNIKFSVVNSDGHVIDTIRVILIGDSNSDGLVDENDYDEFIDDYANGNSDYGDVNDDGLIDLNDLIDFAKKHNKQSPQKFFQILISDERRLLCKRKL